MDRNDPNYPQILTKKHWDWPKPFQWVPRSWTAVFWGAPKKIVGNQTENRVCIKSTQIGPAPIPEAGSWQLSRYPQAPGILRFCPLYFAITLRNGWSFRIGARWDDVDNYVQIPDAAIRHYTGSDNQDTSTKP